MSNVYVLLYIQTDTPSQSEVLGVYKDKESAVDELLERANYRERKGKLTQYMEPTDDYPSFAVLRAKVVEEMELHDYDIYRIEEVRCQERPRTPIPDLVATEMVLGC